MKNYANDDDLNDDGMDDDYMDDDLDDELDTDHDEDIAAELAEANRTVGSYILERSSPLRLENPELYGELLSASAQIDGRNGTVSWLLIVSAIAFCVAIHMSWMAEVFGMPVEKWQSGWVYFLILLVAVMLNTFYRRWLAVQIWAANREQVRRAIQESYFSHAELLAKMEGDGSIAAAAWRLKTDPSFRQADRARL